MIVEHPIYRERPELHILITEDDETWFNKIRDDLVSPIEEWDFHRSQFILRVKNPQTVQEFKEEAGQSLAAGALVYATLDLNMPIFRDDTATDEHAGEMMIKWCLEQHESDPKIAGRLEFCLISGKDLILDRIKTMPEGEELKKRRVKQVHKASLQLEGHSKLKLDDIGIDIRNFLRRNVNVYSYVDRSQAPSRRVPMWFGDRQPLIGLLAKLDNVSDAKEDSGIYIIFSDAAGYEVEWVQLCCSLLNRKLSIFDARRDPLVDNWDRCFRDPPEALLIRNIEYANMRGFDLIQFVEGSFFEEISASNSLVFFQFPLFETQLGISQRLDEEIEKPVLYACLRHIYGEGPPFPPGIGLAFKPDPRIVTFPPYETLKDQGVVRKTILLQAGESSREAKCKNVGIDRELFEVLAEIDWAKSQGMRGLDGLQGLRQVLNKAYQNFTAAGIRAANAVNLANFAGTIVEKNFNGELGLQVRGRLLYSLLENTTLLVKPADLDVPTSDPKAIEALANLETLYQIYDGLDRLIKLRNKLGFDKPSERFSIQDYDALQTARTFLEQLFEAPEHLRAQIAEFRSCIGRAGWRRFYPQLETRKGIAAVENIRFSWPFTRLHLHPSVAAYLKQNGIRYWIHRDIDKYLSRYPDLQEEWRETEHKRRLLTTEVMCREEQRDSAGETIRDSHARPIYSQLHPREDADEPGISFTKLTESFLRIESLVAICENYYVFKDLLGGQRELVRELLHNWSPSLAIRYLCSYVEALQQAKRITKSIFHLWARDWTRVARQSDDAVRLASHLAKSISKNHAHLFGEPDEMTLLQMVAGLKDSGEGCTAEVALKLFHLVGRLGDKDDELDEYVADLRDLMRRMIAATSDPDHRLGIIDDGGRSIELWCKGPKACVEPEELLNQRKEWANRLVAVKEGPDGFGGYEALFPIDDLIRLQPDGVSFWAIETPERWCNVTHDPDDDNVTHDPDDDEEKSLDPCEHSWLPDPEQVTSSKLWRTIHE